MEGLKRAGSHKKQRGLEGLICPKRKWIGKKESTGEEKCKGQAHEERKKGPFETEGAEGKK